MTTTADKMLETSGHYAISILLFNLKYIEYNIHYMTALVNEYLIRYELLTTFHEFSRYHNWVINIFNSKYIYCGEK